MKIANDTRHSRCRCDVLFRTSSRRNSSTNSRGEVRGERLDLKSGVVMQGDDHRIILKVEDFKPCSSMPATKAICFRCRRDTIGREAKNETLNGVRQPLPTTTNLRSIPGIPATRKRSAARIPVPGSGDSVSRLTTPHVPNGSENAFPQAGRHTKRDTNCCFEFCRGPNRRPLFPTMMPNQPIQTIGVATDFIGETTPIRRPVTPSARAYLEHEIQKGLTLVRVRKEARCLAKDEFVDNGNGRIKSTHEARRIVADYVVTEHDCRRRVVANDPVGMGNYNMDSHTAATSRRSRTRATWRVSRGSYPH